MTKQKAVLASFILLMLPAAASAASGLWNEVFFETIFVPSSYQTAGAVSLYMRLKNPGVSITYHAEAFEIDDRGQKIRGLHPGDILATGRKVLFTFPSELDDSDISWYATGSALGTPYGVWVSDAADPGNRSCTGEAYATNVPIIHESYMGTPDYPLNNTAGGYGNLFASLSVAPPVHSIEVSGPVSCVDSGDRAKVCTLTGTGNVAAVFRFASTSANFYGSMYHVFTREDFINPSYGQVQGCDNFGALHPSIAVPEQTLTFTLTTVPATTSLPYSLPTPAPRVPPSLSRSPRPTRTVASSATV